MTPPPSSSCPASASASPAASDQDRTKSLYDLQWNRFPIIRPEEDRATLHARTGWTAEDLAGRLVLDGGCGMGRYLKVASEAGAAQVVGFDLSQAVRAARQVNARLSNVHVVRGDLFRPPLPPRLFDRVYSIGALDHTPDPRRAFLALAELVAPGGSIAVWVYPRQRPALEAVIKLHRAISTHLPLGVLMTLSRWAAPIGGLKRRMFASKSSWVRRLAVLLNVATIGVSMHPDPEVRVCDTLDWYAPRYASRHTLEEVVEWFQAAGLVEIENLSGRVPNFHVGQGHGINVRGRRPTVSQPRDAIENQDKLQLN
ncbi:Methyltransferase type 11 [Isosphaera pallida ATCC 43644]|uniref:Methyltransferase type 11 n=1 Tax=Isosphaera pallida (strain ATCC 43644 / DSM 9630 / IS1B) TaxID=575540 RepID=E8QZ35_ISOPI|nr:class I SAM-dependent methyltransferase [Isosphaera pallida]ADV63177.1 Methyltransferase type 11 [Isosphaera pallida ATCC 43644]